LPSNTIYRLVTDDYGYIWMTTEKGLVRFDGTIFRPYTLTGADNEFVHCYRENSDILWLFNYSGSRVALNLRTQQFVFSEPGSDDPSMKSPVILAYQREDTLAMYRINGKYTCAVPSTSKKTIYPVQKSFLQSLIDAWKIPLAKLDMPIGNVAMLLHQKPYAIQLNSDGIIIGNKIFQRGKGNNPDFIFNGSKWGISENINSYVKRGNDLYLGFLEQQKLVVLPGYFDQNKLTRRINPKIILKDVPVTSLAIDYQGNLWAGSLEKGIFLFNGLDLASQHYTVSRNADLDYISGISKLSDEKIAMGYDYNNIGIWSKGKMITNGRIEANRLNEIRAVFKTGRHWFVFGSQQSYSGMGAAFPNKLLPLPVSSHSPFKDGHPYKDGYYFTTKTNTFYIDVKGTVSKDNRYEGINTLTICPLNDSVCYYGTTSGIYLNNRRLPVLSGIRINKIRICRQNLLICTQEGAFMIPVNKTDDLQSLVKITGYGCYDVKSDKANCYFRTTNGIFAVSSATWQIKGELSFSPYSLAINDFLVDRDSIVLATAGNGIIKLPVVYATAHNKLIPPRVYINSSLSGYRQAITEERAAYSKKLALGLHITVLDYSSEPVNVKYGLQYNDDEISNWLPVSGNTISLNNLKPGNYTFRFRINSLYSGWNTIATHRVSIIPLWYQTNWFKWLLGTNCVLVIILAVCSIYRLQIRKAKQKLNDMLRMNELESRILFSQIKPHFVFNMLTPLQSFFINGDAIGGLEYLDNFARLMRGMLNEGRESFITLEKEILFLQHYLFLQRNRFDESFDYRIEVSPVINPAKIFLPTLLLQPIVENAIEHGIKKINRKDGLIEISVENINNTLNITIRDNGVGIAPLKPIIEPNHALEIIQERIGLINKKFDRGMLIIRNNGDQPGLKVAVILPIFTEPLKEWT